jgi:hypothetical protein
MIALKIIGGMLAAIFAYAAAAIFGSRYGDAGTMVFGALMTLGFALSLILIAIIAAAERIVGAIAVTKAEHLVASFAKGRDTASPQPISGPWEATPVPATRQPIFTAESGVSVVRRMLRP